MTAEEIQWMIEMSSPLVVNPLPWSGLDEEQQAAFRLLLPSPSFTDEQQQWLRMWWLPVTEAELAVIAASAPAGVAFAPRLSEQGIGYLSADILSDALDDGPLSGALETIANLPLTFDQTIEWPEPLSEE